jgi:hypothetical protein
MDLFDASVAYTEEYTVVKGHLIFAVKVRHGARHSHCVYQSEEVLTASPDLRRQGVLTRPTIAHHAPLLEKVSC